MKQNWNWLDFYALITNHSMVITTVLLPINGPAKNRDNLAKCNQV